MVDSALTMVRKFVNNIYNGRWFRTAQNGYQKPPVVVDDSSRQRLASSG